MTGIKNARCGAPGVSLSATFEAGTAAVATVSVVAATAVATSTWTAEGREERPAAGEQY
ncbi:hypothetical protein M2D07_028275 [Pseudomonas sp. BGr12]|uniref:hypothetical protein n=1 Tax=unclassified Pseudomonas TaxID=196821 RepID=UPI00178300AD|nr:MULTISPECIES: hypothetical protein [unclassified Pseudomonas]MBD9503320.1 hypothetical protein [Pseudomonas sp. PDM17]MBD9573803.1 hypothetical protein [Pseudomonas sp. PDM23]MBD9671641.1 hypothetical protein [Pseudomonas sp. PDM21]MDL2430945.1 hypothetical protein [Pseudomonas sp. BJa5]